MCNGFLSVLRGHSSYRARRSATNDEAVACRSVRGFDLKDTSGDGSRVKRHCFDLPPLGFYREANTKTCDCYRGLANSLVVMAEWDNNGCFMAIKLWRSGYVTGHLKADGDFLLTVFCCQQLKDPQRRRFSFNWIFLHNTHLLLYGERSEG